MVFLPTRLTLPKPIKHTSSRSPQPQDRVPLKIMKPLELRDYVSSKLDKGNKVACLQEMTVMMACLKANEFDQAMCSKEITMFQQCCKEDMVQAMAQLEAKRKGIVAGEKRMSCPNLNAILKKFPNPK